MDIPVPFNTLIPGEIYRIVDINNNIIHSDYIDILNPGDSFIFKGYTKWSTQYGYVDVFRSDGGSKVDALIYMYNYITIVTAT